jgi:DNA polymerase-3 subunit gamma/tau
MNLPVKYRPRKFEDVTGQHHDTRTLANALRSGRIAPVYLFAGPRGVGKTTTARILAMGLNCTQGPTPNPCGKCRACIEIMQGRSLAVVEMDAASQRGIDDIREIREKVHLLPPGGKHKVYIIDEAHMLTREAFNALLKTLEEPPERVTFVLATTEPHKIPETVQSRAQRFSFQPLSAEVITRRLLEVAGQENISLEEEAARRLAEQAEGGMRDALSLLEQAAVFAGDRPLTVDVVEELLGLPPTRTFEEVLEALAQGSLEKVIPHLESALHSGTGLDRWVQGLTRAVNHLIQRIMQGESLPENLNMLTDAHLLAWARMLLEFDVVYRHTRFPELLLEYTLMRMAYYPRLLPTDWIRPGRAPTGTSSRRGFEGTARTRELFGDLPADVVREQGEGSYLLLPRNREEYEQFQQLREELASRTGHTIQVAKPPEDDPLLQQLKETLDLEEVDA